MPLASSVVSQTTGLGIAFTIGVVVQYISRHLFTFQSSKRMKVVGPVWCGFAMTAIGYFLFIKGLKGSSFVTPEAISWVQAHTLLILAIGLVVSWIVMFSRAMLRASCNERMLI